MTDVAPLQPELRTELVARSLLFQDMAHQHQREAAAAESMGTAELVDFEAEQRRQHAILGMSAARPADRMGGPGQLAYWRNPDGTDNLRPPELDDNGEVIPGPTQATVLHGPAVVFRDWDGSDELVERERRAINIELASFYDPHLLPDMMTAGELAHPAVQRAINARPRPPRGALGAVERSRHPDLSRTVA